MQLIPYTLRLSRLIPLAVVIWLALPMSVSAATPAEENLGRILINVSGHGEAWYVNPQSKMRVSLGRPNEALERLSERALQVNYFHIERLAELAGAKTDEVYAKQVAGFILAPNDLPGASWYVDPATGRRLRLASPDDAWALMQNGVGVTAATLKAIPIEPVSRYDRPRIEQVKVKSVLTADTLELADGSKVRILNVDTPANPELQQAAMERLSALIGTNGTVSIERDVDDRLSDFRILRHVFANGSNLGYELVRNGLAFHDFYEPNFKYAEQFVVASIDAARLKRGFWNH